MNRVEPTDPRRSDPAGAGFVMRMFAAIPARRDDAVAIVNGLFGDTLEERGSRLATAMTLRVGDTILPLERRPLRKALVRAKTTASPRISVFVHGLMSNESIWQFPDAPTATYGTLLAETHDMTVLALRYNTGRHVSTNGQELAEMLNLLMKAWPVRVRELNLIGHSMGGLVVRSACHYGATIRPLRRRLFRSHRWTSKARRIVLIGAPNTGAGLEALVNSASAALWAIPGPATRLVGRGLDRRSAGIKDLRFGAIVDEDWIDDEPRSRRRNHPHRALELTHARCLLVAGTVTSAPEHPVARRIGDALVTESSAIGLADDGELFPGATTRVFPKVTHIALAHHPDIYDTIAAWW